MIKCEARHFSLYAVIGINYNNDVTYDLSTDPTITPTTKRTAINSESAATTSMEDIDPSDNCTDNTTRLAIFIGGSVGIAIILITIGLCLLFICKKGNLHLPDSCRCKGCNALSNCCSYCQICIACCYCCCCYTCMASGCCKYCGDNDCIRACTEHHVESLCGGLLALCVCMSECSKQVSRLREEI